MQNIDSQHLAELQEASWTILKQKIDIWLVCLCNTLRMNSGRLFHWINSWRKLNQIIKQNLYISQKVHYVMRKKRIHSWKWFSIALSWSWGTHKTQILKWRIKIYAAKTETLKLCAPDCNVMKICTLQDQAEIPDWCHLTNFRLSDLPKLLQSHRWLYRVALLVMEQEWPGGHHSLWGGVFSVCLCAGDQ